jgi:hypothetical protein
MLKLIVVSLTLAAAQPALAEQAARNPETNARFGALRRPPQANPYSRLFETPANVASQAAEKPKSQVVCGMTIIEADPWFDQKMSVAPNKDANVKYTIRAVDPPICNPPR